MVINYWQVIDMSHRCARILQNQFPFVRTNAACQIRSICLKYSIGFWRGARTNGPNLHDGADMSPRLYGRTMQLQFLRLYCVCPKLYSSLISAWLPSWGKKVAVVLYDCMWVATPIFLSLLFPFLHFSASTNAHLLRWGSLPSTQALYIRKSQFPW